MRAAALSTLSIILAGCASLTPQQAAPLISDEAAGSAELYLTSDEGIQDTLESIAARTAVYIAEHGLQEVSSDFLNVKILETVFLSGHRGPVEFGRPGNGTSGVSLHEDGINLSMTGDLMVCWGIRVTEEGDIFRTGIFNPPCEADGLREAEWSDTWPERPDPDTSPEGFEFGTPPSDR